MEEQKKRKPLIFTNFCTKLYENFSYVFVEWIRNYWRFNIPVVAASELGTAQTNRAQHGNSKLQNPNSKQIPNSKFQKSKRFEFKILVIRYCLWLGAWKLVLPRCARLGVVRWWFWFNSVRANKNRNFVRRMVLERPTIGGNSPVNENGFVL